MTLLNGFMDKNKAVYKLKGIPPIYCINLDDKQDRWEYMEDQFKYWEIEKSRAGSLQNSEVRDWKLEELNRGWSKGCKGKTV